MTHTPLLTLLTEGCSSMFAIFCNDSTRLDARASTDSHTSENKTSLKVNASSIAAGQIPAASFPLS